jgi:hypothetical protein
LIFHRIKAPNAAPKMNLHAPNGLEYCRIHRNENTQEARPVGKLGVERRAPPLIRLSPVVSPLLARIAQHTGFPDAKTEKT